MKKPQPTPPAPVPLPPLGPPNYHGPAGRIDAETLALVARLEAIRRQMEQKQ